MAVSETQQLAEVLQQVRTWPVATRITLARRVLESLEGPTISDPPKTMRLEDVIGLLKTEGPPPNDRECEQIVEDERLRKYG